MRTYMTEFPAKTWPPVFLLEVLAKRGWIDTSWGNDAAPSFAKRGYVLWCDAEEPAYREMPGARYEVYDAQNNLVYATEYTESLVQWLAWR